MKICAALPFLLAACHASNVSPRGGIGFDDANATAGWRVESTDGTGPHATWQARADATAVTPPNVVALTDPNHASDNRFNLFWNDELEFGDGRVSVAVRADSGAVDQGGGPMWRVQDADNYYVCRWNPLESNYRVYVVAKGVRRQLATALVETDPKAWHRLEIEHRGSRITCWMDGVKRLEADDSTIGTGGGVGVWTKADACTSFDDLVVVPAGG
jgi:hypothetical protein